MGKARNPLAVNSLPIIPDINEEIFRRAGISQDDRAQLLKKIFEKTVKRMQATHIKAFHTKETGIVYTRPLVDHGTQGKAIEQAMELVGLQKQDAPKVMIKANVVIPSWGKTQAHVVEAPSTEVLVEDSPNELLK